MAYLTPSRSTICVWMRRNAWTAASAKRSARWALIPGRRQTVPNASAVETVSGHVPKGLLPKALALVKKQRRHPVQVHVLPALGHMVPALSHVPPAPDTLFQKKDIKIDTYKHIF